MSSTYSDWFRRPAIRVACKASPCVGIEATVAEIQFISVAEPTRAAGVEGTARAHAC